jgi:hypothetical protein
MPISALERRQLAWSSVVPARARKPRFLLPALLLSGLSLALLFTACADLSEVAKFAASAKAASTGYSDIVNDFSGSAKRRLLYARDADKSKIQADIDTRDSETPDLLSAQKPLLDYIAALAAISTDTTTSASASTGTSAPGASGSSASASSGAAKPSASASAATPSSSSMQKAGMTSTQATAAMTLAGTVAKMVTAGYRSDKAGKAIHDCNKDLQDYLKGLEQIVGTDYPLALGDEEFQVNQYYSDLTAKYQDKEPLAALLLQIQKKQDLDAIAKRKEAAAAYTKILTDIGDGHQRLYDAGEKISATQLVSIVEPYVSDIVTQTIKVRQAF